MKSYTWHSDESCVYMKKSLLLRFTTLMYYKPKHIQPLPLLLLWKTAMHWCSINPSCINSTKRASESLESNVAQHIGALLDCDARDLSFYLEQCRLLVGVLDSTILLAAFFLHQCCDCCRYLSSFRSSSTWSGWWVFFTAMDEVQQQKYFLLTLYNKMWEGAVIRQQWFQLFSLKMPF